MEVYHEVQQNHNIFQQMDHYLEVLDGFVPFEREAISQQCQIHCPNDSGVYLFIVGENAQYVGRTNRLIRRLQMHGWANPYSAALSMAIVKETFL